MMSKTDGMRSSIRDFRWNASVNKRTGLAQSIETSYSIPVASRNISFYISSLKNVFENYPNFLGLNHIIPGVRVMHSNCDEKGSMFTTTYVRDVVFGVKLLEFGTPKSSLQRSKTLKTCLPILGGFLVQKPFENREAIYEKPKKLKNFGYLEFTATCENYKNDPSSHTLMITTKIIDYPPRVAGPAPVCSIRKELYLKSQSILHAYVMRRFHSYCHKVIIKDKEKNGSNVETI